MDSKFVCGLSSEVHLNPLVVPPPVVARLLVRFNGHLRSRLEQIPVELS